MKRRTTVRGWNPELSNEYSLQMIFPSRRTHRWGWKLAGWLLDRGPKVMNEDGMMWCPHEGTGYCPHPQHILGCWVQNYICWRERCFVNRRHRRQLHKDTLPQLSWFDVVVVTLIGLAVMVVAFGAFSLIAEILAPGCKLHEVC